MNVRIVMGQLSDSDNTVRREAQDSFRNAGPTEIDEILTIIQEYRIARKRWLAVLTTCAIVFPIWALKSNSSSWPIIPQMCFVVAWITLSAVCILLNLGGLAGGLRPAVEALTYIDTSKLKVVISLIDNLGFDLPGLKFAMCLAISRLVRGTDARDINEILTPRRVRLLWRGVVLANGKINITFQQADDIANIVHMLSKSDNPNTQSYLKHIPRLRSRSMATEIQNNLRVKVNDILSQIDS